MTGPSPSPLTSPEATDLLTWEREQSHKLEVIHTNCEEEASATSSTEELTRAVAAKLRKPKKKSTADNVNADDEEQKRRVSFKTLSKLEKRRALWEAKAKLDQGTSSVGDSTILSGYTGITEGTAATTSKKKSRGCHTHMCFTGYDNTNDEEAASITSDNTNTLSYDETTLASYSTWGAKSLGNKSLDMEDIDEEEYLNKMGLGMCRLENALQTCCPWLLCGTSGGPEVILEEEEDKEECKAKNKKMENVILFEREISDTGSDETKKSKSSAESGSKSNVRSGEEVTSAAVAMDAKKAEAVLEHNWTLCGGGELHEEDEDNSIDWEETIDWNKGGDKKFTDNAKKDEVPAAVDLPSAIDVEKPTDRQDNVIVVTEESKSMPAPKLLSVKERLVRKMRKMGGVDDFEGVDELRDDDVAADGATLDIKQSKSASVLAEPASIQTETASVSSKTRTVTPTPSKTSPSSTPAVSTPLRAIILRDDPSTPTFLVAPYKKEYSDSDEDGFEQGIDARQPPSIPNTPLKADVPSMIPLPSTPNSSTLFSAKQKFARAMMKLKKDSCSKNSASQEESDEGRSINLPPAEKDVSAAEDRFPSIPSTPLKADIPSTPLPDSNPSTPLSAAAIGAATVSATTSTSPKEAILDEGIEVDEAFQSPAIPSTPLKAAFPTVALPNSSQTTPLVDNTTSSNLNIKQKLARAIKLRSKPEEPSPAVEVNVEKAAKNVGAEVVFTSEAKAPSTIMGRAQARRVGEEVIFTRVSGDEDAPSSAPSSPSNLEPGEVINATDLLKSSPSSSFGMRAISKLMQRNYKNNDGDKRKEGDGDEDNVEDRVVPALPDAITTARNDVESVQAEGDKIACADLASVSPTPPMMRLTNAISFHSQTSAANTADDLPPANDKNKKDLESTSAADPPSAPSHPSMLAAKTKGTYSPSAVSMIGVLANAMSFVTTDEFKEGKYDMQESPTAALKKEGTRDIDPVVTSNRSKESPSILAKAMSFVSTDDNNVMTDICGADTTNDDINEPLEVAQTPSSEVNTPFDVTRETSIATARISNRSPVFMDLEKKTTSNLIQPIAEESNLNQKACKPAKRMSIRSKSWSILNKAKSCSLVRSADNETKSQKSVPSVTTSLDSFALSDYTQKIDNSSPKNSQKKQAAKPSTSSEKNIERNTKENESDASNKESMTKKSGSKFVLLLMSKSRKKKNVQLDGTSACTGNVTTDLEENTSAISSPSRSVVGERSINESDKQSNATMEPKQDEVVGSSANVSAATSQDKATKSKKKKKKGKNGWREYTCPNTGDKYYSNGTITTWDKPAEFDEDVDGVKESEKRVTTISFAC